MAKNWKLERRQVQRKLIFRLIVRRNVIQKSVTLLAKEKIKIVQVRSKMINKYIKMMLFVIYNLLAHYFLYFCIFHLFQIILTLNPILKIRIGENGTLVLKPVLATAQWCQNEQELENLRMESSYDKMVSAKVK